MAREDGRALHVPRAVRRGRCTQPRSPPGPRPRPAAARAAPLPRSLSLDDSSSTPHEYSTIILYYTGMAARRAPAFTVSAAARDNPLVREMYDDEDEDEDDGRGASQVPEVAETEPAPNAPPRDLRARFEAGGDASTTFTLEPAFQEGAAQRFRKEPAGGLHRSRPPQVIDSMSGSFLDPGRAQDAIPRVDGAQAEGLASVGLVLMQAKGQAPVVAELTPKGMEMSDVSKYVRSGDRIVQVDGQAVLWSMSVAEV